MTDRVVTVGDDLTLPAGVVVPVARVSGLYDWLPAISAQAEGLTVLDGSIDQSATLQAIIDAAHADFRASSGRAGQLVALPPGRIRIDSTVTVPTTVRLWSLAGTTFECYVADGQAAFHLTSSADGATPPVADMAKQEWVTGVWLGGPGGIRIINKGTATTSTALEVGQRTSGPVTLPTSRYRIENVDISGGFGVGLQLNTINHYIGAYSGVRIEGVGTCVQWGTSGATNSNSGENFRFVDSLFAAALIGFRGWSAGNVTFNRCSFDYIGTAIELNGMSYNHIGLIDCHLEGINEGTRYAVGNGVIVSNVTDRAVVFLHRCKGPIETDRAWFKGANLTLRGDYFVDPPRTSPAPVVPAADAGLVASGVNAAGLVNLAFRDRKLMSKFRNITPGGDFAAETVGLVAGELVKFTVFKSASAATVVEVVSGGSESSGKALSITIPNGHNVRLTSKAKAPLRNGYQRWTTAIIKPSAVGLALYGRATYYDADGLALNTPSDQAMWRAETIPADGTYYAPAYLTGVGVGEDLVERAASATPAWNFVNNTGAAATVVIGLLYFGD